MIGETTDEWNRGMSMLGRLPIKAYRSRSAMERGEGVSVSPDEFASSSDAASSSGGTDSGADVSQDDIERFEGDSGRAWSQRRHYAVSGNAQPQPLALMTREERDERRAARRRAEAPITEAQRQRSERNRRRALLFKERKRTADAHIAAARNVYKHRDMMKRRETEYKHGIGRPRETDQTTLQRLIDKSKEAHRRAREAHEAAKEFDERLHRLGEELMRY